MTTAVPLCRRLLAVTAVCAVVLGLLTPAAQARVFVGIGIPLFGPPAYYYPPPVYYPPPPPMYYAPPPPVMYTPPLYSPPPAMAASQAAHMCYAAPYTCPMDMPVSAGSTCYCLGNAGQRVYGRAN